MAVPGRALGAEHPGLRATQLHLARGRGRVGRPLGRLGAGGDRLRGGRDRQLPIPFGPYLEAAGWITMLYGEAIRNAYLDMFL